MTIIVFGATGMVGKQLVQQALFKGHTVKAFGRNVFSEFGDRHQNLELIKVPYLMKAKLRMLLKVAMRCYLH